MIYYFVFNKLYDILKTIKNNKIYYINNEKIILWFKNRMNMNIFIKLFYKFNLFIYFIL